MAWTYGQEGPIGTVVFRAFGPYPNFQFLNSDIVLKGTSAFTALDNFNFTAANGEGSGNDGKGFVFTTGDGGGGTAAGGNNVTVLGSGSGSPRGAGLGSSGIFGVLTSGQSLAAGGLVTNGPAIHVDDKGVGIFNHAYNTGAAAARFVYEEKVIDPVVDFSGFETWVQFSLTGNSTSEARGSQAIAYTDNSAFNYNLVTAQRHELDLFHLSPSVVTQGVANQSEAITYTTCTGAVSTLVGSTNIGNHRGTGLVTQLRGGTATAILNSSGTAVGGNATDARAFSGRVQNLNTDVTPGVITAGYAIFAETPTATGEITTVTGVYASNQAIANTTTSYGLRVVAQTQGVNTTAWSASFEGGKIRATPTATVASASNAVWDGFNIAATTVTISGTTSITSTAIAVATVSAPTITTSGAGVAITNVASFLVNGTPTLGANVTATNVAGLLVFNAAANFQPNVTVASATAAVWDGITAPVSTLTLSGSTAVTSSNPIIALMTLYRPAIITAATITHAAALQIVAGPVIASGGGVITNSYAIQSIGNIRIPSGVIGHGTVPTEATAYAMTGALTTSGTTQTGLSVNNTSGSDSTIVGRQLYLKHQTAAVAFTQTNGYGWYLDVPTIGAASAMTTMIGGSVQNQGNASVTTSYGLKIEDQSGSGTNWAFFSGAGRHQVGGTAALLGFYGVTPIVRAILATGAGASVDNVISALQNLGLVKQS